MLWLAFIAITYEAELNGYRHQTYNGQFLTAPDHSKVFIELTNYVRLECALPI